MRSLYYPRGFWRGLLHQPAWHLREYWRSPAYRALHRFHNHLKGHSRFTQAEVSFVGRPIVLCDAPSFLCAWDEIFVKRIYDVPSSSGEIPCLVDAGANIGLAALFWKWRYERMTYVGFEPDPAIADCCRRNLRAWKVDGELIEAAVGNKEGSLTFIRDGADGGRLQQKHGESSQGISVAVKRLGAYLPPKVDLLKIDVEGAEAEVIDDIVPLLYRVRSLFVEWHSRSGRAGLGRAIEQLETAGYDCYVQVASGPPRPFVALPTNAEFVQHLNVYAVRP